MNSGQKFVTLGLEPTMTELAFLGSSAVPAPTSLVFHCRTLSTISGCLAEMPRLLADVGNLEAGNSEMECCS
jgi:hypothetical protein